MGINGIFSFKLLVNSIIELYFRRLINATKCMVYRHSI